MRNGQAFGGLHDAEHDLPADAAVLGQAELANLAGHLTLALHADRRHVVEHDRQVLIDQRPQHRRQGALHRLTALGQRVHGAQQPLVRDRGAVDSRHPGAFEPAQDAELGRGIAQPVEDHHPEQSLGIEGAVSVAQHPAKRLVPAQLVPQRVQHPRVAHRQRRGKAHRGRLRLLAVDDAVQTANQGIGPAGADLLQATQRGDDALAGDPAIIAVPSELT